VLEHPDAIGGSPRTRTAIDDLCAIVNSSWRRLKGKKCCQRRSQQEG